MFPIDSPSTGLPIGKVKLKTPWANEGYLPHFTNLPIFIPTSPGIQLTAAGALTQTSESRGKAVTR